MKIGSGKRERNIEIETERDKRHLSVDEGGNLCG